MSRARKRMGGAVSSQPARRRGRLALLVSLALLGAATSALLAGSRPATAADPTTSTGPSCPASNAPDELTLAGGTPQSAKLDSPFVAPFQVLLAASNGCPVTTAVAGTAVTFSAPANGSSTASGSFAATGSSSATVGTDANGSAQAPAFTANDITGSYTVTASSAYGSVTFNLTNTAAGVAATITAQPPLSEAAFTGATYNKPLQVSVLDANGNPVEGATVIFTLGSGSGGGSAGAGAQAAGASFAGGQIQASEQTNASGLATSPPLSADGTPGRFTATAVTAGVTVPASFQLDNVAGKAPTLTLLGASHRSALIGSGYGKPLQVEVLDAAGKPVQGASVTFTLGSSAGGSGAGAASASAGASFAGGSSEATETTGARGRASSPLFTANETPGTFSATVSVSGRATPLIVTFDNLAGKPPVIRALGTAHGSATVNRRYRRPLEVRLLDAHGKPVQGTSVTFSLAAGGSGGGSGAAGASASAGASFLDGSSQAIETTNAEGIAVSPAFTADGTAGAFAATASVSGVTNPAMFALDNLAAGPPAIRPSGAEPRSATVGGRYPTPLRVTVVAADGKPEQGTTVSFTLGAAGGGGTGSAGSAGASFAGGSSEATETTNAAGQAVSPAFAANTLSGTFTATASISGASRVASFPLRNLAGRPTTVTAGAAASEETSVGTRFPIQLAVTVKDVDGNPVAGAVVTFTAPTAGASGRFAAHPHARRVRVKTNSDGIAVAPAFIANKKPGGYVVAATVKGAAAAFALVNQPHAS